MLVLWADAVAAALLSRRLRGPLRQCRLGHRWPDHHQPRDEAHPPMTDPPSTDLAVAESLPAQPAERALPPNGLLLGENLTATYERFYRSAYAIANPQVAAERAALLSQHLRAETLIEPVPSYRSSGYSVLDAARALGLDD